MARIAVILADLFEDAEYTVPVEALLKHGHKVVNVGLRAGITVKGKKKTTPVKIDRFVGEVSVEEFDGLLIPGGYSPDKLRAYDEAVSFVRKFVLSGKPVFAICHGPQLLISADVVRNKRVTGWKSIIVDLKNAGVEFVDAEVVVDGNLVTSRSPADLNAFVREMLKKLS